MAHKNKLISNPIIKQDILFLQTAKDSNGELLEMLSTYHAQSKEPPGHYHPLQEEEFTVIAGELTVRLDGEVKTFKPGDTLHVPKNKIHSMWNASGAATVVNWKVRPAMNTEHLIETFAGLAADGKTNEEGRPSLLQLACWQINMPRFFALQSQATLCRKYCLACSPLLPACGATGRFIKSILIELKMSARPDGVRHDQMNDSGKHSREGPAFAGVSVRTDSFLL